MRLYDYLRETDLSYLETGEGDIPIDKIIEDCEPFLKELKKSRYDFLYTGRMSKEKAMKKEVRKNRKPRDTPEWAHNIIDEEFESQFGVKARSQSLFSYKDVDMVNMYGDPYFVFPKGKYILLFSEEIQDLYGNLGRKLQETYGKQPLKIMDRFEKSDELVWNSLRERYEPPNTPGTIKARSQDHDNSITKNEFMKDVKSVINEIVSSYEKTTSPKDAPKDKEVMIITSEVWLMGFHIVDNDKLIEYIDQRI